MLTLSQSPFRTVDLLMFLLYVFLFFIFLSGKIIAENQAKFPAFDTGAAKICIC